MDQTTYIPEKKSSLTKELFNFALIIIFIVLPIRLFIAQPFVVVGSSMEPTFMNNDYLIIDELNYRLNDPERGEVVVFKYHNDDSSESKYFIKRIIGLPGETVEIKNGEVRIFNADNQQGFVLDETYIKEPLSNTLIMKLDTDEYFVMGDNRDVSFDSRSWGALSKEDIVGRVFVRLLPVDQAGISPGSYVGQYADQIN